MTLNSHRSRAALTMVPAAAAIIALTAGCSSTTPGSADAPTSTDGSSTGSTSGDGASGRAMPVTALLAEDELPDNGVLKYLVTKVDPNAPTDVQVEDGTATYDPADCGPQRPTSAVPSASSTATMTAANGTDTQRITEAVSTDLDDIAAIRANVARCSTVKINVGAGTWGSSMTRTFFDVARPDGAGEVVTYEEKTTGLAAFTTLVASTNVGKYSVTLRFTSNPGGPAPDRAAFAETLNKAVAKAGAHQ